MSRLLILSALAMGIPIDLAAPPVPKPPKRRRADSPEAREARERAEAKRARKRARRLAAEWSTPLEHDEG